MTREPDFFDLVGDEGSPEELEQLRRGHDLMIAAGPPPELSPRLADAPAPPSAPANRFTRRRRGATFLLAAGIAAAAFGVGFLIADRNSGDFPSNRDAIAMHPPTGNGTARGSLLVGEKDAADNWPLLVHVSGLKPLPKGVWYELYLTRKGKLSAWCGAFAVKEDGRTTVHLSVPYPLKGAGWVVTTSKTRKETPLLTT